jgi:RNA recognition motif-containing protein
VNTRLFVGGLPWTTDNARLKKLVEEGDAEGGIEGCGLESVEEAVVICERDTGKSRGFAFVTMHSTDEAKKAIKNLNGKNYQGRVLKVDEAADRGGAGGGKPRRSNSGFQGRRSDDYRSNSKYGGGSNYNSRHGSDS